MFIWREKRAESASQKLSFLFSVNNGSYLEKKEGSCALQGWQRRLLYVNNVGSTRSFGKSVYIGRLLDASGRDPTILPLCLETSRSETETVSGISPVGQSCVACVFVHSVPLSVYRVCAPKTFELVLNGQRPSRLFESIHVFIICD